MSWSRADEQFAKDLASRLESDGITTQMDQECESCGKQFTIQKQSEIRSARHIVCIASGHWGKSARTSLERYSASIKDPVDYLGQLLPIFLSDRTTLPSFMRPLAGIDCTTPGSLDRQYLVIRDHILYTRQRAPKSPPTFHSPLPKAGSRLPPLNCVFVLGHPGAGKSTFSRVLKRSLAKRGFAVEEQSDYPFLQALFRLDVLRGNETRFDADPVSEFRIKDPAVFEEALTLIHDEVIALEPPKKTVRIIELARARYGISFLHCTLRALPNSIIVYIDAPLSTCRERNEGRRSVLETLSVGKTHLEDLFDRDPDMHYVPPSAYEDRNGDLEGNQFILALMPTRGFFRMENMGGDLDEYEEKCRNLAGNEILPLAEKAEEIAAFHGRRIKSLQRFSINRRERQNV